MVGTVAVFNAAAADVARGQSLYSTWCAGCHGADPRNSQPHLAANDPTVLDQAIALVAEMGFLRNVFTPADIADVAAYIGSVADTGVTALNPTPASVDFSAQDVGTASAPRTLLLTNLGSMPLTIHAIDVAPADFAVSGNCIGVRNPSATCALQLVFTPSAAGAIAGRVTIGIADASPLSVPVLGAGTLPPGTPAPIVVEYYEPELDHYFITGDAIEQAFIDSGAVGRWLRTGNAFRAGGADAVCRFYGNTALNANGVRFGPNSHFITADPAECAWLESIFDPAAPSWKFESLDFATTRAAGSAAPCTAGTVPVYRAYNNGSARGIDSNHRITTNRTAIDQVVARGWRDEGIVMCAPGR